MKNHAMLYRVLAAFALNCLVFPLAAQVGSSGGSAGNIPSFSEDIWPTFVVKCNNDDCHGKKGSAFPKFTSYLMVNSKKKKILKKFDDKHDPMPPADAPIPITDIEIDRIRTWIEAGAPDN